MTDDENPVADVVQLPGTRRIDFKSDELPILTDPESRTGCMHETLSINEGTGETKCRKCRAVIEPVAALRILAKSGDRWANAIASVQWRNRDLDKKSGLLERAVKRLSAKARKLGLQSSREERVEAFDKDGMLLISVALVGEEFVLGIGERRYESRHTEQREVIAAINYWVTELPQARTSPRPDASDKDL